MKQTLFFFLLTAAVLSGCSSKDKVSNPKDIGPQVMAILEEMNDVTHPEFAEYFISWNSLQEIAKNKKLVPDEGQRLSMRRTSKKELKMRYIFLHQRLKLAGKRLGINWKKIKFVSFNHKAEERGGAKFYVGEVKFKFRSTTFRVETVSIYDGSHYLLTNIGELREWRG